MHNQRLGAAEHVHDQLSHGAGAERPHVKNLFAHFEQMWPGALHQVLRAADNKAQFSGAHSVRHAGHAGIDHVHAFAARCLPDFNHRLRQYRTMQIELTPTETAP